MQDVGVLLMRAAAHVVLGKVSERGVTKIAPYGIRSPTGESHDDLRCNSMSGHVSRPTDSEDVPPRFLVVIGVLGLLVVTSRE